jgi:hypothetical protein
VPEPDVTPHCERALAIENRDVGYHPGAVVSASMQSKIVAIVEDDPSMLKGLVRLLAAYGFEPAAYESAEAFWE